MGTKLAPYLVGILALAVVGTTWRVVTWGGPSGTVLGDRDDQPQSEALQRPPVAAQPALTSDPTPVAARSAIVLDAASGTVLVSKAVDEPVPIASTTKVMSAIVLLRSGRNLDESVTISQSAAGQIGSTVGLRAGESVTLRNLLAGLLLVSGNDAADAVAESFGSVPLFVNQMNATAAELGLKHTQYTDPAGLDDAGRSTPFDLATLFRYALTFDEFRRVSGSDELSFTSSAGNTYQLKNSNRLVRPDQVLYMADVLGGKTGFTPDAGHCLVTAAKRDGHLLIAVVLRTDDESADASAREANRLLNWTFDHTQWQ